MARRSKLERKIDRCYYWTSLSREQCLDRYMPLRIDNNDNVAKSNPIEHGLVAVRGNNPSLEGPAIVRSDMWVNPSGATMVATDSGMRPFEDTDTVDGKYTLSEVVEEAKNYTVPIILGILLLVAVYFFFIKKK